MALGVFGETVSTVDVDTFLYDVLPLLGNEYEGLQGLLTYDGADLALSTEFHFTWEVTGEPFAGEPDEDRIRILYSLDGGGTYETISLPSAVVGATGSSATISLVGATGLQFYAVDVRADGYTGAVAITIVDGAAPEGECSDEMNCDCEVDSPYQTLSQLRLRMMRRLGYAAMASNPPPGMAALLNEFLYDAQKQIYDKNIDIRTRRKFKWTMTAGQRFYGFGDDTSCCDLALDPTKIEWIALEDLRGQFTPMTKGIPPHLYTSVLLRGLPHRYEVTSCIEVFPAPDAAYTLWIKGDFGLLAFASDDDPATIDDHAIFLLALGNAKAHYGQKDANSVLSQAGNYVLGRVGAKHGTRRYIPGVCVAPPLPRPSMDEYSE
jgi:hypothetical protein